MLIEQNEREKHNRFMRAIVARHNARTEEERQRAQAIIDEILQDDYRHAQTITKIKGS